MNGTAPERSFHVLGAVLVTAGMLLLVYTIVEAPEVRLAVTHRRSSAALKRGFVQSPRTYETAAGTSAMGAPRR